MCLVNNFGVISNLLLQKKKKNWIKMNTKIKLWIWNEAVIAQLSKIFTRIYSGFSHHFPTPLPERVRAVNKNILFLDMMKNPWKMEHPQFVMGCCLNSSVHLAVHLSKQINYNEFYSFYGWLRLHSLFIEIIERLRESP